MSTAAAPIRSPLRAPGVARLLGLSMVARTPEAAVGLLFILRVRDLGGSFALAGIVSATLAVGLAVGAPLLGRLIDRRGQTGVLTFTATVASAAIVVAGLLPHGVSPIALLPLALVTGVVQPPVAPCLRALFGRILPDDDARHGALAMDAALQEISFMAGPLVFVTALAAFSPAAGLVAAGAALLAGTLAFASAPESRDVPAHHGARPAGGAIASPGIRTLLIVAAGLGALFGAIEVSLAAAADHDGHPAALGILLAIWSVPSLLAGLVSARRGAPVDPPRTLVLLVAITGLGGGLLALMPNLWTLAIVLAASGAIAAPMFAVLYSLVGVVAEHGTVTEAFTWLGSGIFAGIAIGGAVGGILISGVGVDASFAASGVAGAVAALVAARRSCTLRAVAPVPARAAVAAVGAD